MTCPTCTADTTYPIDSKKARVVKTQNTGQRTHRIYRCPHEDCGGTFHTIEIPRERFRALETIEREARNFADRFHRQTVPPPSATA